MATLPKGSVESILSFDAEMFPVLPHIVEDIINATETEYQIRVEDMEQESKDQRYTFIVKVQSRVGSSALALFTQEEKDDIKKKIRDYQAVKGSGNSAAGTRTGGASLLTELQKIEYFKEGLLSHLQAIRDILKPKEISRATLVEKEKATQDHARKAVASSFAKLDEKLLRGIAESVLGDKQLEYTKEELPLVLATQQITGALLEPGKVA